MSPTQTRTRTTRVPLRIRPDVLWPNTVIARLTGLIYLITPEFREEKVESKENDVPSTGYEVVDLGTGEELPAENPSEDLYG